MCQVCTHLSQLSRIEVGRISKQGRMHIHCQHAKPTQTVQDQEESNPGSWCNNAPMSWNWYLVLQHAKEYTETATHERCKKQVQQELAKQQVQ